MPGSRFEQKYIVTEEKALEVRRFIASRLELDEHGAGKANSSYPVHSLYLDSDDLKLYWDTINGEKDRVKLRLRFYDDSPDAPVFFEFKQRMNKCRIKKRAAVRRNAVDRLLSGHTPWRLDLISEDAAQLLALQEFCDRVRELQARPTVHVAFFREAYMGDNSVRLTMDREVRAQPEPTARLSTTMTEPIMIWGPDVILELKFTREFPELFRELVSTLGLRQCGAAKYVDSVATMGEYKLRPPGGQQK
jgi:SPX domain protein involved in polyphosphate accumulation